MKRINLKDLFCLFPLVLFLAVTFNFFGEAPSLDPMINYRHSVQFFKGGVLEILKDGATIHPPLLYLLQSLSFLLFGQNPGSVNLMGFILFIFSSISVYFLFKEIFGRKMAIVLQYLLFSTPLIIVNYFYMTSDILILSGIILALISYLYKKWILLAFSLVLLSLMKETALVILIAILFIMIFEFVLEKKITAFNILRLLMIAIPPFLFSIFWSSYLSSLGTTEWRDTLFVKNNEGSYSVVLRNLFTLSFLNKFLFGNLFNAFILNFQWIYFPFLILLVFLKNRSKFLNNTLQKRTFLFLIFIGLFYILLVLSFPTWTVPRYSIPVLFPFLFIVSLILTNLKYKHLLPSVFILLMAVLIISNFKSIDPLTSNGKFQNIYTGRFYDTPFWNSGPDRIIYNRQFLKAVENQNSIMQKVVKSDADMLITYCDELKLGEKFWTISVHNEFYPELSLHKKVDCVNFYELNQQFAKNKIENKIVFLRKSEEKQIKELLLFNRINVLKVIIEDI